MPQEKSLSKQTREAIIRMREEAGMTYETIEELLRITISIEAIRKIYY